ncbi:MULTISPECIES: sulfatase [unclassified Lentimonas]|uniref:sulfatase n=1 Tax=unclassified Lentimonas TaxID=2630993 RepID=UPI0013269532|nr:MULTISPECIES: sulfatase [unclassified Lentimonas]CAA6676290.1 Unannotated [Lentimonas sp. CC4]CAA6683820.1 Unannotated [Lentimonas sp. CC6]CAA7077782.1 Unannotated [Lentimonas sp. CC4]CAA7169715.1 Unannotated [Lentimonas sp. CC21]CAA7179536.1 Unannotated [Lentimonas sp. CC8]
MKILTKTLTLFCSLALPATSALGAVPAPNIVFILVDDLGYGDVGFNGSTFYETPHIDALAQGGLILDSAYMYPTCSPSRTALATGKHSFRTGIYTVPVLEKGDDQENIFSRWTVGEEHTLYSQPMADAGYQSIFIGKWHLVGPYPEEELSAEWPLTEKLKQPDPWAVDWVPYHKSPEGQKYYPEGRGYLQNIAGTYRGDPALEIGGYKGETGGYFSPFNNPFMDEREPKDEWLTDHLTTKAIEFMDAHKEGPFFVDLHYYTVHAPLRARSPELLKKYIDKPGDPITGQGTERGKRGEHEAMYATMIESLDDNVGRIVDYLDQHDLRENTVIVFSSDNGQNNKRNDLLRGCKGYIYEGGIKVPTFVNWPGKVTARRSSTTVTAVDFFPTLMDIAGIDYDGLLDGESFAPLFTAEDETLQERSHFWHIASQYKHGACSVVRKGNYKLIQFLKDGSVELYDLKADPKESKNLVQTKPETAEALLSALVAWRTANAVPLPPESPLAH